MSPAVQPDIAAGDVPIATEWPWSIAAARWPWARVQRCAGDAVAPGVVVPARGTSRIRRGDRHRPVVPGLTDRGAERHRGDLVATLAN